MGSAALCHLPTTATSPAYSSWLLPNAGKLLAVAVVPVGRVSSISCSSPSTRGSCPVVALLLVSVTATRCTAEGCRGLGAPRGCASLHTPYGRLCYGCSQEPPSVRNAAAQTGLHSPRRGARVLRGWQQDSPAPCVPRMVAAGTARLQLTPLAPVAFHGSLSPEPCGAGAAGQGPLPRRHTVPPRRLSGRTGSGLPLPAPAAARARAPQPPYLVAEAAGVSRHR